MGHRKPLPSEENGSARTSFLGAVLSTPSRYTLTLRHSRRKERNTRYYALAAAKGPFRYEARNNSMSQAIVCPVVPACCHFEPSRKPVSLSLSFSLTWLFVCAAQQCGDVDARRAFRLEFPFVKASNRVVLSHSSANGLLCVQRLQRSMLAEDAIKAAIKDLQDKGAVPKPAQHAEAA